MFNPLSLFSRLTLTLLTLFSCLSLQAELQYVDEAPDVVLNNLSTAHNVVFDPPKEWRLADPASLPKLVKIMVVGKGAKEFPPSINLGIEPYKGTLKQYLKRVKEINQSQNYTWKDLGKIRTQAGEASLSQVDKKTNWGETRMMHVIMVKDDNAYILTATSLKEEFPKFYKDFFASLRSFRFSDEKMVENH